MQYNKYFQSKDVNIFKRAANTELQIAFEVLVDFAPDFVVLFLKWRKERISKTSDDRNESESESQSIWIGAEEMKDITNLNWNIITKIDSNSLAI